MNNYLVSFKQRLQASLCVLFYSLVSDIIVLVTRLITCAQPRWIGCKSMDKQRIYFPNHVRHADFVLVWSSLPKYAQSNTRPIAGGDYWCQGKIRSFLIHDIFKAVLIDRTKNAPKSSAIEAILEALEEGSSIIFFPEGTRNTTEEPLLKFKSGLFHLASQRPDIELVPVWIENLNRVLPKGEILPVPLLCTVNFGTPIQLADNEPKNTFIQRAHLALMKLREDCHRRESD